MHIIAVLGTLVIIGFMAFDGFRSGLYRTAYMLFRHILAFLVALTLAAPVANLTKTLVPSFKLHPGPQYLRVVSVGVLFGVVVGLGRYLRNNYTPADVQGLQWPDKIGGGTLGLINGIVLSGFVLILWTLMPFVPYVPGDMGRIKTQRLPIDSGAMMLKFYKYSAGRMGGGRPFLLEGEPILEDTDRDGRPDGGAGSGFDDLNGNGEWDPGWLQRYRNHAEFRVRDVELATTTKERRY